MRHTFGIQAGGSVPPTDSPLIQAAVQRKLITLERVALAIPVGITVASLICLGLMLLGNTMVVDSLYNDGKAVLRVSVVILALLSSVTATHFCYTSTERSLMRNYARALPLAVQQIAPALKASTSPAPGRPAPPRNLPLQRLLARLCGQFYRACKAQHIPQVPAKVWFGPGLLLILVSLALLIVIYIRYIDTITSAIAVTPWEGHVSNKELLAHLAGAAGIAGLIALPVLVLVEQCASRAAVYRLLLENGQVLAALREALARKT